MVAKLKALFGFRRNTSQLLAGFRKTHLKLIRLAEEEEERSISLMEKSQAAAVEHRAALRAAEKIGALLG